MTLAQKLTPELVRDYHGALLDHVDAELVTIKDVEHGLTFLKGVKDLTAVGGVLGTIFKLLEQFEIFDPMEFLRSTALAIPIGFAEKTFVYVPWIPGNTQKYSLATQVEILSHEVAHVVRANDSPNWLGEYLLSFAARTREERKAFQTSLEICFLLHGNVESVPDVIGNLTSYFLRPTDEKVLIAGLDAVLRPIREGDRSTPIGKWAANWFKEKVK
jgi:hypothetical protein